MSRGSSRVMIAFRAAFTPSRNSRKSTGSGVGVGVGSGVGVGLAVAVGRGARVEVGASAAGAQPARRVRARSRDSRARFFMVVTFLSHLRRERPLGSSAHSNMDMQTILYF